MLELNTAETVIDHGLSLGADFAEVFVERSLTSAVNTLSSQVQAVESGIDFGIGLTSNDKFFTSHFTSGSATGNNVVQQNQWNHLVVTYDGSNIKLFVNGNLDSQESANGNIANNLNELWIGKYIYYGGYSKRFYPIQR